MNLLLYSWGGAIVDLVALAIIIITMIRGARQGFIKAFFSTFGWLISLILAVLLCGVAARFLENKFGWISSVSTWLSGITVKIFGNDLMNTSLAQATESGLSGKLSDWIIRILLSAKESSDIPNTTTLNQIICPTIAYYIVCIISLIALFFLFKILFRIISHISRLNRKSFFGRLNSFLGCIFGLVKGIIILDFIILIISAIPFSFAQNISLQIANSIFAKVFTKINVISILFNALFNGGAFKYVVSLF